MADIDKMIDNLVDAAERFSISSEEGLDVEAAKRGLDKARLVLRAEFERQRARCEEMENTASKLIAYREANTLNFQLEKLDDYIGMLKAALERNTEKVGDNERQEIS